jgi:WD40 repeat protein/serine/threonine protein kinase
MTMANAHFRASRTRPERPVPTIDGYEIVGELGRGGMGVVYRARQVLLNRPCVLKMILAGAHADAESVVRFLAEAEVVARLQHPNIVQIHHIGQADGLPYFELEYLDGGSLDRRLDGTPWPARRAAELVGALARGVAQAHHQGVIHRDLKPGNVLLSADGTPKIADFGLAKSLAGDSGLTRSDSILGSPGYMAPEQAAGKAKEVGPLADIYALGAILYELLTGRPPFTGATVLGILEQVKTIEPVPPSRLVPGLPRDVETIALKCLQKEPGKRYDLAAALAADLHRFVAGEPIVARPVPPWERAVKWARRRPAIAGLVVSVLLLLASLLGLGIWSYAEVNRSLTKAERLAETESRANANAQEQTKIANRHAEDLAWEDYINRVNRAYREVQDDNIALAEDLLHGCPIERRGWEWHYVKRLCNLERLDLDAGKCVNAIAFSPDGTWIVAGSGLPNWAPPTQTDEPSIDVWDAATGRRQLALRGLKGCVYGVAASPDGRRIAVGSGFYSPRTEARLSVWDAATGKEIWSRSEPDFVAMSVAFSPDSSSLAAGYGLYSGDSAGKGKVWDVATGQETMAFPGPVGGVNKVAFHPDGRRLAVAGSGVVEVWDLVSRTKVLDLRGHTRWVYSVAFSPDGKWLSTGGWDRTVKLWEANTGVERVTLFAHKGFVLDLAFSPDGHSVVTTSEDRSIKLWEIPSGRELGTFHGHTDFVQAVAFRLDGREIATGGHEGSVKVWDLRTSRPVVFGSHTSNVVRLATRRDGRRVLSESDLRFRVKGETTFGWDPLTGELDAALTGASIDGLRSEFKRGVASGSEFEPGATTGTRSGSSPDGTLVAEFSRQGGNPSTSRSRDYARSSVLVLETSTGRVVHTLIGHTADALCAVFSPDGRRLATASLDRTIKLWDTATGKNVFTLTGHTAGLLCLAYTPDGNCIVSGGIDFTARVWNATPLSAQVVQEDDARYQQKVSTLTQMKDAEDDAHRGEVLARKGQWSMAAAALGKAVERAPDDLQLHSRYILSLLEAGDLGGSRRAVTGLLSRTGKVTEGDLTTSHFDARDTAWLCALVPDAVTDPEVLVRLADSAVSSRYTVLRNAALDASGAALYRAGRFEEAIRCLDESVRANDGGFPQSWAFLAMAHHRLGHQDEAHRWLDKLRAYEPKEGAGFTWKDVDIRILRREAESLIVGSRPAASPTSDPAPVKKATVPTTIKPESTSTTRSQFRSE